MSRKRLLPLLLAATLTLPPPALAGPAQPSPSGPREDYAGKTVILCTGNLRGDLDLYPKIARARRDYEAKGAHVILADAGNCLRGSAAANATRGEAIYSLMDAAGYDVAAMGGAEFSYADATTGYLYHGNYRRYYTQAMLREGTEALTYAVNRDGSQTALLPARAGAKFQTVCSNVAPHEAYFFQDHVDVTTPGGLTVRFLGLLDPAAAGQVQDGYVTLREPAAPLDDFSGVTVTLSCDPALAGEGGTVLAFDPAAGPACAALVMDNATGAIRREPCPLGEADPEVAALAEQWKAETPQVLFQNKVTLNGSDAASRNRETNLGDLVTDALRWYAENHMDGLDKSLPLVAIQNGGNCDDFLYPGPVTDVDLLRALPFSPMGIGAIQLTGSQLLEVLEAGSQCPDCPGFPQVSGLKYTLDLSRDYDGGEAYGSYFKADSIQRVTVTEVDGRLFDPHGLYTVVCDNFLLNGNDTYYTLKEAKEAGAKCVNNGPGVKVRDVVALYCAGVLGGSVGEAYAAPRGRIALQRFSDVPAGHWGFGAVDWAVEQGVTRGTGEGLFSPDRECTVWEIETFISRVMGGPQAPFDPRSPLCTRGRAVELLWQAAGAPRMEGSAQFSDLSGADDTLLSAVAWAVAHGVTTGTGDGTVFSPEKVCSRGEIVTLLHRAGALLPSR